MHLCAACGKPCLGPLFGKPDVVVCNSKCLARIRGQLKPKRSK